MDYIEASTDGTAYGIGAAALLLIGVILVVISFSLASRDAKRAGVPLENFEGSRGISAAGAFGFWLAILGPLAAVVAFAVSSQLSAEARSESLGQEIQKSYGFELTTDQLAELNYPEDRPSGGFESYGSTLSAVQDGDGKIVRRELFLIWTGDSMALSAAGIDGEILPLAGRS